MSDYSDLELQEQLMNQLEEMQTEIDEYKSQIRELKETVSKRDSQLSEALDRAEQMSQQSANFSEVQELTLTVQTQSKKIVAQAETIKSLNDKIGKLAESDNVLKLNEELKKQNELLKKQKQDALNEAMTEVSAVKSEYSSKITSAENAKRRADQREAEAISLKRQLSAEADQRAEQMIKDKTASLEAKYKAREASLVSYVAIFGIITAVVTILSLIRQKTFWGDFGAFWKGFWNIIVMFFDFAYEKINFVATLCDQIPQPIVAVIVHWLVFIALFLLLGGALIFGIVKLIDLASEPVSNGINPWNISISVILLVAFVFFGDYIKNLITFNLWGLWLILTVILIGVGMYVHSCRANRGYY